MPLPGSGLRGLELGTKTGTMTLVVVSALTYYVCWRWSESSRARRVAKRGRSAAGSSSLPSPVAVLPRWIPFVGGHTLQMESEKMIQQVEGWADEFGGDYEITLIGKKMIVVTGAEDIRRMLLLRPSKFRRGWRPSQFPWMSKTIGVYPSLFVEEGKEWGRSRRLIAPFLSGHKNVAGMVPSIAKIAERVCSKLENGLGEPVDFVQEFGRYTHDVIALSGFGFDADSVRATKDRSSVSFDAMGAIFEAALALSVDPLAMLGWSTLSSLWPWVRETKEKSSRLERVVEGAIDETRSDMKGTGASHPAGDGAGALLRKLLSVEGSSDNTVNDLGNRMTLSDKEIVTQCKGLFLAGSETTAKTLSWAVYFLAKHPEIHSRCREEALRAAPLRRGTFLQVQGSDGLVSSSEQASQLVFCSAVFKETLRLWPAGPVVFLHSTEATTMESGLELEAGTAFTLLLRYPCLSEESFTRAKDFVPERWIAAERAEALFGQSADRKSSDVVHREEVAHAFGGGPRKCPGMDMAHLEAAVMLAAISARFDLALAPGQADPPEEVFKFTAGVESLNLVLTKKRA
ncbi:unnamed protein product [Ectocarpus fasciculatus]